jgi:hypothetical protein
MLHNPHYHSNDAILPLGAGDWVQLADAALSKERAAVGQTWLAAPLATTRKVHGVRLIPPAIPPCADLRRTGPKIPDSEKSVGLF